MIEKFGGNPDPDTQKILADIDAVQANQTPGQEAKPGFTHAVDKAADVLVDGLTQVQTVEKMEQYVDAQILQLLGSLDDIVNAAANNTGVYEYAGGAGADRFKVVPNDKLSQRLEKKIPVLRSIAEALRPLPELRNALLEGIDRLDAERKKTSL